MDFEKLKIIEAGITTNKWYGDNNNSGYIFITPKSLSSIVRLGNEKPIHARKTHNGMDLLDGYIGSFTKFKRIDDAVYADFTFSPAMVEAFPADVKFIRTMIEKEPDMLGISIIADDTKVWNEDEKRFDITEFTELFTCDLVGLPAATSSLFNNQKTDNKMGLFTGVFAALKAKTKFSEEIVESDEGKKITIRMVGESPAIGDEVIYEDGTVVADGEVTVTTDEGDLIIVVKDGKIEEFKTKEEEVIETETEVPAEFSKRLTGVETTLSEIKTMLGRQTRTPVTNARTVVTTKADGKTKLSKEAVAEATKKFLNKK